MMTVHISPENSPDRNIVTWAMISKSTQKISVTFSNIPKPFIILHKKKKLTFKYPEIQKSATKIWKNSRTLFDEICLSPTLTSYD